MKNYVVYADRNGNRFNSTEYETGFLRFLYHTFIGRLFLKFFASKLVANASHWYMNRRMSKKKVKKTIEKHNIDMSLYDCKNPKCYNDFFLRNLKELKFDNNPNSLISPCDSKLMVRKISDDLIFTVKKSEYNVAEILKNQELANEYKDGLILIFRLTVDDYHHYIYIDDGKKTKNIKIKGVLHTTQPIAIHSRKVYHQNSREYTILKTNNFDDVIFMEVGAMCVGKIENLHQEYEFKKGEEKGKFQFGGSTIILFVKKNVVKIDDDIIKNSNDGIETVVKVGMKIGTKITN
ncbi:MAG: phosphatidylserine decarboxylase [Acholeplasmatales bacterium]|nr:phosphatidylserine decarboxylase [Acholeplasmatales bacterium]